jgi:hypothetical protein
LRRQVLNYKFFFFYPSLMSQTSIVCLSPLATELL